MNATNPFEVALAERLKAPEAQVGRRRTMLNWLFTVIVGAAIANLVVALLKS